MKLITKELEKRFAEVGNQSEVEDPLVIAKFFYPCGCQTWLVTEFYPEENLAYGYVSLFNDWNNEFGYISIAELENTKLPPFGLTVERDMHWTECRLSEAKAKESIY